MPFGRTTISCVTIGFFVALAGVHALATTITFPLTGKWTVTLPSAPAYPPAFDNDRAYVALQTNQLVALATADGATSWSVECPMTTAPAAGDDLVFAGSDGLIEARAKADGRAQWRRPVEGRVTLLHWDTGWLLASTDKGPMLALRAADGEVLWRRELGAPLHAAPAPAGERVYVALTDGRLVALLIKTGEEIWTRKLTEPAVGILPVGDRVFVGARDNQLHALDAEDGDTAWDWTTGADLLGVPVLDQKRVYFVALDNVLRGHSRNSGSMIWKQVLPMRPYRTGPLLVGELLIVSGVASEVRAYNTFDGKPAGEHIVKGSENEELLLAAPPHLTPQGMIILTTKSGQVRALVSAPAADAAPAPAPAPTTTPPADAAPAPAPNIPPAATP